MCFIQYSVLTSLTNDVVTLARRAHCLAMPCHWKFAVGFVDTLRNTVAKIWFIHLFGKQAVCKCIQSYTESLREGLYQQ